VEAVGRPLDNLNFYAEMQGSSEDIANEVLKPAPANLFSGLLTPKSGISMGNEE